MAIIRQCVPTALVFSCLVFSCLVSGALAGKPTCPPDAARPMVELPLAGFKEAATVKLISDRALEAIARNGLSTTNATITVDITPGSPAGAAVARVRAFACAGSPEARPPVASSEPATPAAPVQPTEPPNGRKYTSPRSVADLLGPDIMRALERARHFELRQVAVPAGERNTDLVSYNVMSHALLLANEESDRLREILLRDPAAYLPPGTGAPVPRNPNCCSKPATTAILTVSRRCRSCCRKPAWPRGSCSTRTEREARAFSITRTGSTRTSMSLSRSFNSGPARSTRRKTARDLPPRRMTVPGRDAGFLALPGKHPFLRRYGC